YAIGVRTLGPDHRDVVAGLTNLGVQAQLESRPADAIELLDRARKLYARTADADLARADTFAALARLDLRQDRTAEAMLAAQLAQLGPHPNEHPWWRLRAQAALGLARARLGRVQEGERLARDAVQKLEAAGESVRREHADAARCLATILEERGAGEEARAWRERTITAYRDTYGNEHPVTRAASVARPPAKR